MVRHFVKLSQLNQTTNREFKMSLFLNSIRPVSRTNINKTCFSGNKTVTPIKHLQFYDNSSATDYQPLTLATLYRYDNNKHSFGWLANLKPQCIVTNWDSSIEKHFVSMLEMQGDKYTIVSYVADNRLQKEIARHSFDSIKDLKEFVKNNKV